MFGQTVETDSECREHTVDRTYILVAIELTDKAKQICEPRKEVRGEGCDADVESLR